MNAFRRTAAQKFFIPLLYKYWNIPVFQEYENLMQHDRWSEDKLAALQEQKLTEILRYACLYIPYYQNIMEKAGIGADDIKDKTALSFFPVLTKPIIQERFDDLVDPKMSQKEYVTEHSGGSTGQPTKVRRYLKARAAVHASTWRANSWMGWEIGDPWIWLWGRLSTSKSSWKSKLVNLYKTLGCQESFFNVHGLDKKKLLKFARAVRLFRPKLIEGYTNAFYQLCLLLRQENIELPKLMGVATTAETLYSEQRRLIEDVLGCKVFNRYASSEVGLIASECSEHDGLHLAAENIYIECVKEDKSPVAPGEPGKLLITDLNNRVMPLIRYDLGDMGIISTEPCKCGRPYPLLQKVIGRQSDVLRLPNKKIVFPDDLAEIFYPLPQVRKFQVIQEELSKVNVFVALKSGSEDESLKALIYRQLQEALGDGTDIKLDFVEDIPILSSGKHRICISKVSQS